MLRFSPSVRGLRAALGLTVLLSALAATSCGGWRQQPAHDVAGLSDPNATYAVVLATLSREKYAILDRNAAAHVVRVRSHVDESSKHVSVILLRVDGGAVHLSASGHLVRPDGTTHRALNAELSALHKALQQQLGSAGAGAGATVAAARPSVPPSSSAPQGPLPAAWSEPAYDPSVWGRGNFTCLPVKLANEEQTQLSLVLSNNETADVLLSLAHAPELCRSPASCKLPGGCAALGMADADKVSRLAGRLSKHEIGPLATLVLRGRPIATIDLAKHGSIAQAMADKR